MKKINKKLNKIKYFIIMSILMIQVLSANSVYATGSKMTNTMYRAYSEALNNIGSGLKSALYADLDQDQIDEMIVGKLDHYKGEFYLQIFKYKNNRITLLDQIMLDGFGSNACGMNNFSIVKSTDGKDVALKCEFHHMTGGYGTWTTTYYKLKDGKLSTYLVKDIFSDAGAVISGPVTNTASYQINGSNTTNANYTAVAKKYTIENKIIDTGYSPIGADSDDCRDYTNKGSAIHKSVKEDIKLVINGVPIALDYAAPIQINGTTLVPIRVVSQYLGAQVSWKSPVVTVTKDNKDIKLTLNNKSALVNNQKVTLDMAPTMINNTTMIPLRFVAENLSATTSWNKTTQTVTITTNTSNTSISKEEEIGNSSVANMTLLGQGKIDTLPYKMGTKISIVINDLGTGTVDTFQGVRLHQYNNYSLSESLYSPILVGGFFNKGYTMYGITIGKDNAQRVKAQLGIPEVFTDLEGDEFANSDSTYGYMYSNNNYYLYVYFNAKDIIERAVFIDKN